MKLKQFQQEKIEQILKEEMQVLDEGWSTASKFRRSSLLTEKRLFEDASSIERDLSAASISSALEPVMTDSAQSCLDEFDNDLFEHIVSILVSHDHAPHGVTSYEVREMLDSYSDDAVVDAEMTCMSDITAALEKYATAILSLTKNTYIGQEKG